MKEKNFLTFGMVTLFLVIIISFAFIIINEKDTPFLLNFAERKMTNYVKKKYPQEEKNFQYSKVRYYEKGNSYKMRITNINNKKKYFVVILKNKKMKDTYNQTYNKEVIKYE
ncbi:MAG: hypothetical protein IJH13_04435 [Bacilli bacterium]|nr:hypothetical protein [Bacilli bacterium]